MRIEDDVLCFRDRLPVEYFHCEPPGQIRQRNLGLVHMDERTPLIGFLDDDLILEPDALERMIEFWNRAEPDTAGVGFNVVNAPPYRTSWLARLFVRSPAPGRVLRSGYNSRIDAIDHDIRTQWLGGGYTVWRRDILAQYRQPELRTRWAIGVDIRFSYPVGKQHPLYVCAGREGAVLLRRCISFRPTRCTAFAATNHRLQPFTSHRRIPSFRARPVSPC